MKNKLILRADEFTSFTSYYLESMWSKYFDISYYDADKTYDRSGTVFVVWWMNVNNEYSRRLRDQGYKVIVDNLWEMSANRTDYYWLENINWFWYNESLWWRSLGYHEYQPNKQYSKLALMPIKRQCPTRDQIVNAIGTRLDNFIWSYKDRTLPYDAEMTEDNNQRFFNPQWYDDTYFSVVAESTYHDQRRYFTEKTFKPIAYRHPFLIVGPCNLLNMLGKLGFETYENIFNESYDAIVNFDTRLAAVIKNIDDFDPHPYDSITLGKLQHNHAHFFDRDLVESRMVTEIIEPLINYAETR
jgi:hypothetical protein